MTNIMTSQPQIIKTPLYSQQSVISQTCHPCGSIKSLNVAIRQKEIKRITYENQNLLKRLQEKSSHYNVYEWESNRKDQVKILKKICYYPPSLIKKHKRRVRQSSRDPNQEIYSLYQSNLKDSISNINSHVYQQIPNERINHSTHGNEEAKMPLSQSTFYKNPLYHLEMSDESKTEINERRAVTRDQTRQKQRISHLQPIKTSDISNPPTMSNFTTNLPSKSINLVAQKRPPPMNVGYNTEGIEERRQVLYRNFHQIENQVYLVEISRNQKKLFILVFPNFETPQVFSHCIMTEKQAQKLLSESNNRFEELIQRFYIKFGKLQIQGFHNTGIGGRSYRSVSPTKKYNNLFSVSANAKKTKLQQMNANLLMNHPIIEDKQQSIQATFQQQTIPSKDNTQAEEKVFNEYKQEEDELIEQVKAEAYQLPLESEKSSKQLSKQASARRYSEQNESDEENELNAFYQDEGFDLGE